MRNLPNSGKGSFANPELNPGMNRKMCRDYRGDTQLGEEIVQMDPAWCRGLDWRPGLK